MDDEIVTFPFTSYVSVFLLACDLSLYPQMKGVSAVIIVCIH